ncbi:MAG: hypothetical protein COV30_02015 [Candidatus Yanofskybacteria bacterium CG10_big_fil_rev_8_21_14_0_10_37_15]|uniref:FAD/NAD(P)-binding domain-containing protein n=1 Tax=Candidatus Yanofskybacteria bacterium CG10_big_fil_rev_8_21_14_0_10_37_15 TaxID=1975097 RepID=A0A2H0R5L9_9BACT|nr:MAG: hypothetical protein COV30_02015 [Candidatus Yanofskybacteria bacterium CG10_big_fil_rev_8_21_14_0_10_37_15]
MVKILILGGGFGGIRTALELQKNIKSDFSITLVDKNNHHLFLPALYEVAAAYNVKRDLFAVHLKKSICIPYSDIFENKNIDFIQDEITDIDVSTKKVFCDSRILEYDFLVIALGGQTNDLGITGVKEYAYSFKTVNDGLMINKKLEELIKNSSVSNPVKIFVCGGGFTGVELAAELSGCVKKLSKKNQTNHKTRSLILFEAGSKILPMISDEKREHVVRRLTRLGVAIMENSPIEEIGSNFIKLKNGQKMEGDIIIWTAGIKANDLLKNIPGLYVSTSGKIITDEFLQVNPATAGENVFAVGDNVEFIDPKNQKPIPALAYVAIDQGKIVAKNILRLMDNKKLCPYKPFYNVWVAPIGGKYAIAHLWNGVHFTGFWGWLVKQMIDLRYMLSILSFKRAIYLVWREVTLFTKND